jgi:hypothetical protein
MMSKKFLNEKGLKKAVAYLPDLLGEAEIVSTEQFGSFIKCGNLELHVSVDDYSISEQEDTTMKPVGKAKDSDVHKVGRAAQEKDVQKAKGRYVTYDELRKLLKDSE